MLYATQYLRSMEKHLKAVCMHARARLVRTNSESICNSMVKAK